MKFDTLGTIGKMKTEMRRNLFHYFVVIRWKIILYGLCICFLCEFIAKKSFINNSDNSNMANSM